MPIEVTQRAVEVLRRALELGKMDLKRVAIRVTVAHGGDVRTGFAEDPEPGEELLESGGVRLFVPSELVARGATIDVAAEHDRIIVR